LRSIFPRPDFRLTHYLMPQHVERFCSCGTYDIAPNGRMLINTVLTEVELTRRVSELDAETSDWQQRKHRVPVDGQPAVDDICLGRIADILS
jgi:hypothetical protein